MNRIVRIFGKEFRGYFVSPIAYIVISVFLLITGWFFFTTFFLFHQASLRNFFSMLPLVFSFIIPAITMRLLSEEFSVGSCEALFTLPVSTLDVVLGKYLGAVAFVGVMLIPTVSYPVAISFLGDLDWGPVAGGYLGAILLGAAFSAVGLFASSLTRNQITAFIVGTAICFSLTLLDRVLFFSPRSLLGVLGHLGAYQHFETISKGVIDSRDILYFLSVSFLGLYGTNLTVREMD